MRWLHLSDIHFGYQNASVTSMRKKLIEKAKQLDNIDCLFITGDLRYGKKSPTGYPADTLTFIQELQTALKINPSDTYIVPGNHDVNRDNVLALTLADELKHYSTIDGSIRPDTLNYITSCRRPFLELYEEICGHKEPDWHYCIARDKFNIICLNTAILCGRDGEDGTLAVSSVLLNQLADSVDATKPGIVLAHHDFDSLGQEEQQKLEIALKDMGAVLYLCGHKHVALSRLQNIYRTDCSLQVFLCGTNMDQSPNLSQTDMDFFVGETDDGRSGWVQAYKWYPRAGQWAHDVEFSIPQDGATDGRVYFPKEKRPKVTPSIHPDVLEQYRRYIRQQCSEIELNGLPVNEEDADRRYALRRLFVPLRFKEYTRTTQSSSETQENTLGVDTEASSLIPERDQFRMFVLSDPGGGKSTLLKWISSVFCFPEDYRDIDTFLPKRDLFPVWIRCRDIPEGSRPSIWETMQSIALRGEWLPNGSDVADFSALIAKNIAEGKMLLLIDGLDEIGNEADRDNFVEQLRTFADLYPSANIIVSSRPTGFSIVTKRLFHDFRKLEIAPLEKEDIEKLCLKWNQVVRGDSAEVRSEADALAQLIFSNERILRLAKNPLLLTTLLLVERRVGRLPTKRVELYEEAIRVLLETWNRRGHQHHHIDLDEARYKLAYIAFHMMTSQTKRTAQIARISRSELLKLLKKARIELSELVSDTEKPSDFIRNIEYRSALLIQKGFEKNDRGEREAIYEFQHLTFQEYLAAYAVNKNCYPGAKEEDNPISIITPHLTNPNMKEAIPLVAVRLPRFYPSKLVDVIIGKLKQQVIPFDHWIQLRDILLQFVADEVPLPLAKIDEILAFCFKDYFFSGDEDLIYQILNGKNKESLKNRFNQMDLEQKFEFDYHTTALSVISREISDPFKYQEEHANNPTIREQANIIAVFSHFCDEYSGKEGLFSKEKKECLKTKLFELINSSEPIIQRAALFGLNDCNFVNSADEWSRYFNSLVYYLNAEEQFPDVVSIASLPFSNVEFESKPELSPDGFSRVLAQIAKRSAENLFTYSEQLTLALMGIVFCSKDQDFRPILENLYKVRERHLAADSSDNDYLYWLDIRFHNALNYMIICNSGDDIKKSAVQEYILKTDYSWAKQMIADRKLIFEYVDYSSCDKTEFELIEQISDIFDYQNQILAHIESRMKELTIE